MSNTLTPDQEVQILLVEYKSLRDEIQMYVKEYSPKLTVLGTALVAVFGFAMSQPTYQQTMFSIIPAVVLLVGAITVAQSYLVISLAARVRNIELRIRELNGGRPILQWEHRYTTALVFPMRLSLKGRKRDKRFRPLNPVFVGSTITYLGAIGLAGMCIWKSMMGLTFPWNVAYTITMVIGYALLTAQAWSFFSIGPALHRFTFDDT